MCSVMLVMIQTEDITTVTVMEGKCVSRDTKIQRQTVQKLPLDAQPAKSATL